METNMLLIRQISCHILKTKLYPYEIILIKSNFHKILNLLFLFTCNFCLAKIKVIFSWRFIHIVSDYLLIIF